jgi:hypothetical protein
LLPPPLPHFAIRSAAAYSWRGAGCRDSAPSSPPCSRIPVRSTPHAPPLPRARFEVCTGPLLHSRSRIPPSMTLPSTLQRAAALR